MIDVVRSRATWVGVALGLAGIGLPVLGVPRWLALALFIACCLIALGLAVSYVVPLLRRRDADDDPSVSVRNDRRDLADDLLAYADRIADWLDARQIEAPSVIERNASTVLGGALGEMLRIAKDDPERWEAHQHATSRFEIATHAEYVLAWRARALSLFDQAVEMGVVSPKARVGLEKPDTVRLRAVPDILRKLAARLRVQAADKLLSQYTVGHTISPMRPRGSG